MISSAIIEAFRFIRSLLQEKSVSVISVNVCKATCFKMLHAQPRDIIIFVIYSIIFVQ